jgi:hypothetical protein
MVAGQRKPSKVPLLSNAALNKRISWAKSHENYDWVVVFSDESSFWSSSNGSGVWVKPGTDFTCEKINHAPKIQSARMY